jgi:hypothetical protein
LMSSAQSVTEHVPLSGLSVRARNKSSNSYFLNEVPLCCYKDH